MTSAYKRPKEPEKNRQLILASALTLAATQGLQGVTLQAVAQAAGLTKGGVLHHFAGKEALIQGVLSAVLDRFDAALEDRMAQDPDPNGRFSRAYVQICLSEGPQELSPHVMAALWGEPSLRRAWYGWMATQEARHGEEDLKLVRLAADGLWLALTDGALDSAPWISRLLAATYVSGPNVATSAR